MKEPKNFTRDIKVIALSRKSNNTKANGFTDNREFFFSQLKQIDSINKGTSQRRSFGEIKRMATGKILTAGATLDLSSINVTKEEEFYVATANGTDKVKRLNAMSQIISDIGNGVSGILSSYNRGDNYFLAFSRGRNRVKWGPGTETHTLNPFKLKVKDDQDNFVIINHTSDSNGYGVQVHYQDKHDTYMKGNAPTGADPKYIYDSLHGSSGAGIMNDIIEGETEKEGGDYFTQLTIEPARFEPLRNHISLLASNTNLYFKVRGGNTYKITFSDLTQKFKKICGSLGRDVNQSGWEKYGLTGQEIHNALAALQPTNTSEIKNVSALFPNDAAFTGATFNSSASLWFLI